MDVAIKRFVGEVRSKGKGAISFFYYSGHGAASPDTQVNYLIPVPPTPGLLIAYATAQGKTATDLGDNRRMFRRPQGARALKSHSFAKQSRATQASLWCKHYSTRTRAHQWRPVRKRGLMRPVASLPRPHLDSSTKDSGNNADLRVL